MNQKNCLSHRKKQYRKILVLLLILNLFCLAYSFYFSVQDQIPDSIHLFAGEQSTFSYQIPVKATVVSDQKSNQNPVSLDMNRPFTMKASKGGSYRMDTRLFGMIHLKKTKVKVLESKEVVPCGLPIGIYIKTKGLLVLDTQILNCKDGLNYEPAKNIVRSGDYILEINGKKITEKESFRKQVMNSGGKELKLLIMREGKELEAAVTPVLTKEGVYKLGIWVRDDTQGLGTLTYVSGNQFGALGHGISDLDTGTRMEIEGGQLYKARILSIQKGKKGSPGELIGQVQYGTKQYLGKIVSNTGFGIYGILEVPIKEIQNQEPVPIGLKQDVKKGKAKVRLILDGVSRDYDIEIEKVDGSNKNRKRGMVIRITDKRLLEKTGGIVQGMSGSPILQNGKLIGAVTHVFVDDATRGYGIFIENMLEH